MTHLLTIQQVAKACGLSVHTLRYYEKIGLIDGVERADNSHRRYNQQDLLWLEFLLKLRRTGLPVKAMLEYAELRRAGNHTASLSARQLILQNHSTKLEQDLLNLQATLSLLQDKQRMYQQLIDQAEKDADHDTTTRTRRNSPARTADKTTPARS